MSRVGTKNEAGESAMRLKKLRENDHLQSPEKKRMNVRTRDIVLRNVAALLRPPRL
jgi:hypothetical protein